MPDPIHAKTDFAVFDKTYRFEGDEIIAERNIVVLKNKIPKEDWKKYQAFTKDISLNSEAWIQLLAPSKPIAIAAVPSKTGPASSTVQGKDSKTLVIRLPAETDKAATPADSDAAASSDSTIPELMEQAQQRAQTRDWSGATRALDQVKAKNPNQKGMWALYGYIAQYGDHDYQRAKSDFEKEIAAQPDNPSVVGAFADLKSRAGDSAGARETLRAFLDKHPENFRMAQFLAGLQFQANDYSGALKTYEDASARNPDDRGLRIQTAETLVRLNRNDEAAAAAKSALDGSDDPATLNNAAYVLSESGMSLDIAEDASRKEHRKTRRGKCDDNHCPGEQQGLCRCQSVDRLMGHARLDLVPRR